MAQILEKITYFVKITDEELNELNNSRFFEIAVNGLHLRISRDGIAEVPQR